MYHTVIHFDTAYSKGNATLSGLGSFGDFFTIIVLGVVASLVVE